MPEEDKKIWTGYFTKNVIFILTAIATVLTIVGGIWAFEVHYATNTRVDKVEVRASDDVDELEIQIAGALQNQQHKSDVRYWQFMYDKLSSDIFNLKRQMERYPNDQLARQDYQDLINQRAEVKNKLGESMNKIRVN